MAEKTIKFTKDQKGGIVYKTVAVKGLLYDYNLSQGSSDRGDYIKGTLSIDTKGDGSEVYAYNVWSNQTTSAGTPSKAYQVFLDIMNKQYKTTKEDGKGDTISGFAKLQTSVYRNKQKPCNSIDDLSYSQGISLNSVTMRGKELYANDWCIVCYITQLIDEDATETRPRRVVIRGYFIDDYAHRLCPFRCESYNEKCIAYCTGLTASNDIPYIASIWGKMSTKIDKIETPNAFGEPRITETTSKYWEMQGMSSKPIEDGFTAEMWKTYKEDFAAYKTEIFNKDKNESTVEALQF